jgi:hypothetical protein
MVFPQPGSGAGGLDQRPPGAMMDINAFRRRDGILGVPTAMGSVPSSISAAVDG